MTMTHLLLAGSYAPADRPGIFAFAFDPATGALAPRGAAGGVTNPSFLALHPSGRFLYAVGETSQGDGQPGSVWAFALEREPFALRALGSQASGGSHPCHLHIDPGGRWLFVANYSSGSLQVLPIGADGALGPPAAHVQHEGRGPRDDRQEAPHAHSALLDPAGRHLIVADLGIDRLVVYRLDPETGALEPAGEGVARPGAGPRHMAFHPDGRLLYVANELDNTVSLFEYDAERGGLREVQAVATLPDGAPENTVADIHLADDGRRLYVSNRGHNSLAVFAVGGDGRLERLAAPGCGGAWPRNFALAPGGGFVVVANQHSDRIDVLPLQPDGAEAGASVGGAAVPGASCVIFG